MTGQRVVKNGSRDHDGHYQQRCEQFCVVASIDFARTGHEANCTLLRRWQSNGLIAISVLAQYCSVLPRLTQRQYAQVWKIAALPGAISVAGVIADHEFTIALGNGPLAAAFGILRRLNRGRGRCRLFNGASRNRQRCRALAGDGAETGGKS
jgi:hypothetical protein